jgi:L-lactate dehydrogenase
LSQVRVGGVPLQQFPGFRPEMLDGIEDDVRRAAYEIISAGKASHYGIGNIVAAVVGALQSDTASVMPVCTRIDGAYGLECVTLGLPCLVSSHGAQLISSYPLDESETVKLAASARILREAIAAVTEERAEESAPKLETAEAGVC